MQIVQFMLFEDQGCSFYLLQVKRNLIYFIFNIVPVLPIVCLLSLFFGFFVEG